MAAQDHLFRVQLERSFYKTTCDSYRKEVVNHFSSIGVFRLLIPIVAHQKIQSVFLLTTVLTTPNRCTIHLTFCTQGQFFSSLLVSAMFSEYSAKEYHNKSIIFVMKRLTVEKELML